jgi:hypothetical protein
MQHNLQQRWNSHGPLRECECASPGESSGEFGLPAHSNQSESSETVEGPIFQYQAEWESAARLLLAATWLRTLRASSPER